MAYSITLSADDILDKLKATFDNNGVHTAIEGLRDTLAILGWDDSEDSEVTFSIPQHIVDAILSAGTLSFPDPPEDTPGGLISVDPVEPLRQLAKAINAAESLLNEEHLVIASADVQVDLNVAVGGLAGARAVVKFGIQPKPYV